MKLSEHGARRGVWPSLSERDSPGGSLLAPVFRFAAYVFVVVEIEARRMRHDPTELITRIGQPVLWLLVFGQVFGRLRAFPTGQLRYLDFMAPGILAQSVLFIAIFYGIVAVWERDLGIVYKFLASPAPRTALVLGKALSASLRVLPLAAVVYILSLVLGVPVNGNPAALGGVVVLIVLSAAAFSTMSLIVACLVRTRERFMGIGQLLTMPMFFASNAIYPIEIMPAWLQFLARINPLTYTVDGLRTLMLSPGVGSHSLWLDFGVLGSVAVCLVLVAGWLYPTLGY